MGSVAPDTEYEEELEWRTGAADLLCIEGEQSALQSRRSTGDGDMEYLKPNSK
jgi:hypothetical protein